MTLYRYLSTFVLTAVVFAVASFTGSAWAGEEPTVIELTQTGCQFLESESGIDHGYTTTRQEDCETINAKSGDERLANAKTMQLKPGKYTFRVTNKNVPYMLGSTCAATACSTTRHCPVYPVVD